MVKLPPGYEWPPPPLIRKSSVDGAPNAWYILTRAHDHVWRDYSAAVLLHCKSVEVAEEMCKNPESIFPGEY